MASRYALSICRASVRFPQPSISRVTKLHHVLACHQWHTQICEQRRLSSTEILVEPSITDAEKDYSPKIQKLVQDIGDLTLMEVADLNELLKKTLKITDAPVMAMGAAMPATAAQDEEDEDTAKAEQARSLFTVKLTAFDASKKIALIKEVKSLVEGMNLVQAKKLIESLPQSIRSDINKEEADKLKEALEKAGGTVEVD